MTYYKMHICLQYFYLILPSSKEIHHDKQQKNLVATFFTLYQDNVALTMLSTLVSFLKRENIKSGDIFLLYNQRKYS